MQNVNINKKFTEIDKKLDYIIEHLDDLIMTPEEYVKYLEAEKIHSSGEHKKLKTIDDLMRNR